MHRSVALLLSGCVLIAASAGHGAEPTAAGPAYQLAYKFAAGQEFHYKHSDRAVISTQLGETTHVNEHQTVTRKHFRVLSVDAAGNAELEPVIDHAWMKAQWDDAPAITFDTKNSGEDPPKPFAAVAEAVGRPLPRLTVAANGEVRKGDPEQNFLLVFPAAPVRVGEEWSEKFDVPIDVDRKLKLTRKVTLKRIYRLVSVEGFVAAISLKMTNLTPVHDPTINAQLIQRMPSGTIEFDLERGVMLSRVTKIDKREVDVAGPQSLLHAVVDHTETLVPASQAAQDADAARK